MFSAIYISVLFSIWYTVCCTNT